VRNSRDISKGFFQLGIRQFESSQVSHPVPQTEVQPLKGQKSPLLAGFCNSAVVSELPNLRTRGPFPEESPAITADIPVFPRLSLETRFDLHCVQHGHSISLASQAIKALDWECYARTALQLAASVHRVTRSQCNNLMRWISDKQKQHHGTADLTRITPKPGEYVRGAQT
jgi:hypothetical protein